MSDVTTAEFEVVATVRKPKPEIRIANASDVAGLTQCMIDFAEEMELGSFGLKVNPLSFHASLLNQMINAPGTFVLVVEADSEIIGGAMLSLEPQWLCSSQIVAMEKFWYLHPDWRKGSSIAIRMWKACEEWARDCRAELMCVGHFASAPPAAAAISPAAFMTGGR